MRTILISIFFIFFLTGLLFAEVEGEGFECDFGVLIELLHHLDESVVDSLQQFQQSDELQFALLQRLVVSGECQVGLLAFLSGIFLGYVLVVGMKLR